MQGTKLLNILSIQRVSKRFGGIQALNDVSFTLEQGSITSLIGPNGAGKSTMINVITGHYSPDRGQILLQDKNIAGLPVHEIANLKIGRTFQLEELFVSLSVLENIMVGAYVHSRAGILSCAFRVAAARKEEQELRERAYAILELIGLVNKAEKPIANLPLGDRKLVGLARALSMEPQVLMLDEPVGGLAAHESSKLVDLIYTLKSRGLTVLIIEHNMPFVMSLSEKVLVFEGGSLIAEGPPREVREKDVVIKAYLGEEIDW